MIDETKLIENYVKMNRALANDVLARFEKNGKILVPTGDDGEVEVFQHKKEGVLITESAKKIIESDIDALKKSGDLDGADVFHIIYEVSGSAIHDIWEVTIVEGNTIYKVYRLSPSDDCEINLIAEFFAVNGEPLSNVQHWECFEMLRGIMTARVVMR